MKKIGARAEGVTVVDLNARSVTYLQPGRHRPRTTAMVMSIEAGETPGKTNDRQLCQRPPGGQDRRHPFQGGDVQAVRAASSSWSWPGWRKQGDAVAGSVVACGPAAVTCRPRIARGDWSAVYPEIAPDIRRRRGRLLPQPDREAAATWALRKDAAGNFNPQQDMQVREFTAALGKLMALPSAALQSYTGQALTREVMGAILADAYHLKFGARPKYMTDYNGKSIVPGMAGYDPNLDTGARGAMYYPLMNWDSLSDRAAIAPAWLEKVRDAYELGLMRSENGIQRGRMVNGRLLEPKMVVSRAKAAKALYFMWVLSQPPKVENDTQG
jgi:hypothetical protein